MTTGPGAVPRLGDPVAHQSATARGVLRVLWAEYLCGNLADGGELGVLRIDGSLGYLKIRAPRPEHPWAVVCPMPPVCNFNLNFKSKMRKMLNTLSFSLSLSLSLSHLSALRSQLSPLLLQCSTIHFTFTYKLVQAYYSLIVNHSSAASCS